MDATERVEQSYPYDGPHSRDTVTDAARSLEALVRYLNNATGPGNGKKTLDWAVTVYHIVGSLRGALGGLDQLLRQLDDATERLAGDPTLYDNRRDRPARDTARELVMHLTEARPYLGMITGALDRAHVTAAYLGNDLD